MRPLRPIRGLFAAALWLLTPAAAAPAELPLYDAEAWEIRPDWIGDARERSVAASFTVTDGVARLHVPEPGRKISVRASLAEPIDLGALPYVKVRYRATGVCAAVERSYFLYLSDTGGGSTLIRWEEMLLDGEWHTQVIEPHSTVVADEAAFHLQAGAGGGTLEVASVEFLADYPALTVAESLSRPLDAWSGEAGFATVPLGVGATVEPETVQAHARLSDWFAQKRFAFRGVPFELAEGGRCARVESMDEGGLAVPCAAPATEVYFVLASWPPNRQPEPFTAWGETVRSYRQVERFRVGLDYADGTTDEAFPFCPDTGFFELCRGLQMYAVPAAGRPLRQIRFAWDFRGAEIYLCALTARGGPALLSRAWAPDTPPTVPPAAVMPVAPTVELQGDELSISNAHYSVRFRPRPTFELIGLDAAHGVSAAPGLFRARRALEYAPSDTMRLVGEAVVEGTTVALRLQPEGELRAEFELTLSADESPELQMRLAAINRGDEPLSMELTFPELRSLTIGEVADTWYYFPSHCARLSRHEGANRWAYGGRFPLQFMSAFNPETGRGVYVCTRDEAGTDRSYRLDRRFDGVEMGVEYPDAAPIAPGERRALPPTVIGMHSGDWHVALDAYRRWAREWYVPGNTRPEWFRDITHMRTYYLRTERRNVQLAYDAGTGTYPVNELLDAEQERFGPIDYAHFTDYRISDEFGRFGDYDEFSAIGGSDGFRECLRKFEARGMRTGLYMEGFLASTRSKVAREHGEEWGMRRPNGKPLIRWAESDDPALAMCPWVPGWRRHLVAVARRLQRDFAVDGIYLDEFGFNTSGYFCYADGHGHGSPGRPLPATIAAFREMKEALPEDVALYSEECPADVASRHSDGAFGYSLSYDDPPHTPGRLNTYRFAFPEFRLLPYSAHGISQGSFIDQPKFALFNGLAFYTAGILIEPQGERLFRECAAALREHREAFNSLDAEPLIAAETPGLLINRFPGVEETVFTVFNTHYHTVRAPVLKLGRGGDYVAIYRADELRAEPEGDGEVVSLTIGPREVACFARR